MAKQRLTDRQLMSGVTLTDLLHFVITGDTSQNPAGSSYKGNVEQLFDAFSAYTCTNPLIVDVVNACNTGITINGNVTINGSATTINTEVIQSKDNNIVLNYSGTHLTAIGGGITLEDGQSNGVDSRIYTDSNGTWLFDPGLSASTGTIDNFSANTISVMTIGGSGDCVNDLYVSNIHSCSPLNINPLDEGNVYFGSTSGVTIDLTNNYVGIGTSNPTETLDVRGNNGRMSFETDTGSILELQLYNSGTTGTTYLQVVNDETSSIAVGIQGSDPQVTSSYLGFSGDTFVYASSLANDLNIINQRTSPTQLRSDNINFWAGASPSDGSAQVHIHGSGVTRGYVGINNVDPTERLDVNGNTTISGTLNIGTIGSGTSVGNLGFDSSGQVVTGTTGGGMFTGGTVTGPTIFTNGLSANTISATTYLNLPTFTGNTSGDCITDLFVTNLYGCSPITINDTLETVTGIIRTSGGTGAELNLIDPNGPNGTWSITSDNGGYGSGSTWVYGQPSNGSQLAYQIDGSESIGISVFEGGILPILFNGKEINIGNNKNESTGSGNIDKRSVFLGTRNSTMLSGVTNSVIIGGENIIGSTDDTVYTSNLNVSGNLDVFGLTTLSASGQNVLTVIGSGDTNPLFTIQGSSGELFSITDSLVGSLFSVNDISGLPILEVFDDDTVHMGSYQAPSLNTTVLLNPSTGLSTVYSVPMSAYTGAWFEYTVKNTGGARAGQIMSIFSGNTVNFTETTTTDIGSTSDVTFSMSADSTNTLLQVSATTSGWEVKTIVRSI